MKALVTGGAGFIGSHLVDRLISEGNQVVVLDNQSSTNGSEPHWNPLAENHVVDVCDYWATRLFYENVDVVFHLAADSSIQSSIESPLKTIENNTMGTNVALQCSKENRVKRVVFSSSASVYGTCPNLPLKETEHKQPLNPYALSKSMGEDLCKLYSDLYKMETVCLRYFNVYGENQPSKGQYAPVVGIFLKQRQQNSPLTIVGDGEQRRDFVHVSDVVDANMKASTFLATMGYRWGECYNVGNGNNYSVNEIAEMVGGETYTLPNRIGEIKMSLSDISKTKNDLGWKPKVYICDWISEHK